MKGSSHGQRVPRVTQAPAATVPATTRAATSLTGFGKRNSSARVMVGEMDLGVCILGSPPGGRPVGRADEASGGARSEKRANHPRSPAWTTRADAGPGEVAQVPVVLLADVDEGAARGGVSLLRV